jgi:hypothetical protein
MPLGVCKERCVGCRKCSTSTAQAIKGTAGVKVGKWIELVQSIIVTRSRQQTPLAECAVRIIQPSDKTRQVWSNEIYEIGKVYKPLKVCSVYEYKLKRLKEKFKEEELLKVL